MSMGTGEPSKSISRNYTRMVSIKCIPAPPSTADLAYQRMPYRHTTSYSNLENYSNSPDSHRPHSTKGLLLSSLFRAQRTRKRGRCLCYSNFHYLILMEDLLPFSRCHFHWPGLDIDKSLWAIQTPNCALTLVVLWLSWVVLGFRLASLCFP